MAAEHTRRALVLCNSCFPLSQSSKVESIIFGSPIKASRIITLPFEERVLQKKTEEAEQRARELEELDRQDPDGGVWRDSASAAATSPRSRSRSSRPSPARSPSRGRGLPALPSLPGSPLLRQQLQAMAPASEAAAAESTELSARAAESTEQSARDLDQQGAGLPPMPACDDWERDAAADWHPDTAGE